MASRKGIIGVVLVACAVYVNSCVVSAATVAPRWDEKTVKYLEASSGIVGAKTCEWQSRYIAEDINKNYDKASGKPIEICVYVAKGFEYGYYEREYRYVISPWQEPVKERGFAILPSGNSGAMVPISNMDGTNENWHLPLGADRGELAFVGYSETGVGLNILYVSDVLDGLEYDLATNTYRRNVPFKILNDANNNPYVIYGYGKSENGRFLGLMEWDRMTLFDLDTKVGHAVRMNEYRLPSSWPNPSSEVSITNNGKYLAYGGYNVPFELIEVDDRCITASEMEVNLLCRTTNLRTIADKNSLPPEGSRYEYRSYSKISISQDGGHVDYYDSRKWASIYAYNMRPLSPMRYLALGDSFASGEGDLPGAHETYYIPGTNIVGNYPLMPQEMCHISSRSYPFLLAAKMGFHDGTMKSVACSGAVADDVMTYDTNNYNRIIADNYMGQGRVGSGGPRLAGTGNILGFQDEAREKVLPGRVQQIEHVQKTKPEVVTIMMGGNDLGFGGIMASCANLWNWGRLDDDCEQTTSTGEVKIVRAIQSMYPKWVHMYKNIKANTSSSKVYVMGYPHFLAIDNICSEMAGLYTRSERQSINQTIDYVNATIKNAALDAGVWYIDITNALEGKELCGKSSGVTGFDDLAYQAIMSEYMHYKNTTDENIKKYGLAGRVYNMNPTFLQTYQANRSIETAADIAANPSSTIWTTFQQLIHPNSVGHQALYNRIAQGLGHDLLDSEECNAIVACPALNADGSIASTKGIPSPETYIDGIAMSATGEVYVNGEGVISIGRKIDNTIAKSAGESYQIGVDLLTKLKVDTSKPIKLSIHSDPSYLGTLTKDGDAYSLTATLPNSIRAGVHALHVGATTLDGTILDIVRYVMVVGPNGDIDDDGILDQVDTCAFGVPSTKDDDGDGIADNCDMFITTASQKNDEYLVLAPNAGRTANGILPLLTSADQKDTQAVQNSATSVIPRTADTVNRQVAKPTNKTRSSEPPKWNIVWSVTGLAAVLIGLLYSFRKRRT